MQGVRTDESPWHHPDHGEDDAIDLELASDDVGSAIEARDPIAFADDHSEAIGIPAGSIIFRRQSSSQQRRGLQRVKERSTHELARDCLVAASALHLELCLMNGKHVCEGFAPGLKAAKDRLGKAVASLGAVSVNS